MPLTASLILVGFMGVGKTSVGRLLADQLGVSFCDLDRCIEDQYGSIDAIFKNKGEAHFRQIEHHVFTQQMAKPSVQVVSTGGGIVETLAIQEFLKAHPCVVWLRAQFETVIDRINQDANHIRPLANTQIKNRYQNRQDLYETVSTFCIDVDQLSVSDVAQILINRYG